MSTTTSTSPSTRAGFGPLHPVVSGMLGAVAFGAAMASGEAFDLNRGDGGTSASTWAVTALIALVGLAIGIGVGLWGWAGDATRLSRTAIGLAIAGAILFIAFWSGWPSVFSAVALGLALEHRRRIGSFGPSTAIATGLGVLTFVATAFICVTG